MTITISLIPILAVIGGGFLAYWLLKFIIGMWILWRWGK